jgi:hypothetical protein
MPKGNAAIGSVLPREKTGVESVPCSRLTSSTGVFEDAGGDAVCAPPPDRAASPVAALPLIAVPIAASPVALRKLRLLPVVMPDFKSELMIPFPGHSSGIIAILLRHVQALNISTDKPGTRNTAFSGQSVTKTPADRSENRSAA